VPTLGDGILLALVGPVAGIGSTLIVRAYRSAPPGRVGVLEYTMMLWAILWSVLVFGEAPSWAELGGAALIAASGAYALLRAGSDAVVAPVDDER
jgi:drug/metabolite transporter (DMT)-like permease